MTTQNSMPSEKHGPSPQKKILRRWIAVGSLMVALLNLAACGGTSTVASTTSSSHTAAQLPIRVTVFSPGSGDKVGVAGAGYVIDLSLDATSSSANADLSAAKGYKPFFNNPTSSTFHPGPDQGVPGLVALLSTAKTISGTAFQGPETNLAGLFQINGVASVHNGSLAETWNTWLVGKPIAGSGVQTTLTVVVVKGTAPTVISGSPQQQSGLISNIVQVTFTLNGAKKS
jgi:hypothetical protein